MFSAIKKILGLGPTVDYGQMVKEGAIVLDVRTPGEYASGHIKGSLNIPVDRLRFDLQKIQDKQKPIITCCASGMRSATAKSILTSAGYEKVVNGGRWRALQRKL